MSESANQRISEPVRDSRFKPYPEYRDSGVEWLGEVPVEWEVKRLKNSCRINQNSLAETTEPDFLLIYIDISNVDSIGNILAPQEMFFDDAPSRARRLVKQGDTIVSTVRTYLKAIAFMENPAENCVVSTGFAVLSPQDDVIPKYLWRLMQEEQFINAIVANSEGVSYPAISPSKLSAFSVPVPPLSEQRAIAEFLDRETARIDALVSKKERLVELLREKRAALISHAVTKGLDPAAEMKDSGVEWLGEIPVGWEVKRLKFCVSFYGGGTPSKENPDFWNGDIPWVSPKDMKADIVYDTQDHITQEAIKNSSTRLIDPRAVLVVVRSGILRHSIPVATNDKKVAINQDMKALVVNHSSSPRYLKYLIMGLQDVLLSVWRKEGTTVESIEQELLANSPCLAPPVSEQHAIADYLDHETARIDALVGKVEEAIERLREYRTALISAAVTGKIDVRAVLESGHE